MTLKELRHIFSSTLCVIVNPRNSYESLGVKQSLIFYYKALPVPLLAVFLISGVDLVLAKFGTIAPTFWSPSLSDSFGAGGSGSIFTPLFPIAYLLTYPIFGLFNAAIFQLVSKTIFRIWKGSYAKTFTAIMYGMLPVALFLWILSIPLTNLPVDAMTNLLFLAMYLWSAITTIISLAVQHDITKRRAFVGFIAGMIVIFFTLIFYYNFAIITTITLNMMKAIFG